MNPYTVTLQHVEQWDHSGDYKGRMDYVTMVGGPCVPGRAFQLPYKAWKAMGSPETVKLTIEPVGEVPHPK